MVMSITTLPVQEVGKLLWGQTLTEEVPAHETHVPQSPIVETEHPNLLDYLQQLNPHKENTKEYYSSNDRLRVMHHAERLLRPPIS